jgi:hypothetical protein
LGINERGYFANANGGVRANHALVIGALQASKVLHELHVHVVVVEFGRYENN